MTNKLKLKTIYILIILYSIYDVLNSTSAGNSDADRTQVYFFLFAIVGCLALFCLRSRFLPKFSVMASLIVFAIYYIFDMCIIKGNIGWTVIVYFGLSTWWILTVWFFYDCISKDLRCFISIQNFMRVMFIIYSFAVAYGAINISINYSVDYARVGYIYHILAILPMIMLERDKKIKVIFVIISIGLTIFSFKRGAIVILPVMLLGYYLFNTKTENRKANVLYVIGLSIVLFIAWKGIDIYSGGYLSSRFSRVELSDGSGRSAIWNAALQNISKRNFFQSIFGIPNSRETALWTGIHNEWISYLNTNGVIGLILFAGIVLSIIAQAIRLVKKRSCLASAYMSLVVYMLGVCWVSGFYHVHSTFYVMLFLGTTQGLLTYKDEDITELLESG